MKIKDLFIQPSFQITILLLGLILYIISPFEIKPYVGFLTGFYLITAFIIQIKESAKERGLINELKEVLIAFVIVLVFFFVIKYLLNTENPISAIASCSMVDELKRGDLIIISNREENIKTQIKLNASIVPFTKPEVFVLKEGKELFSVNGSLIVFCENNYSEICKEFFLNPSSFSEKKEK